MLRLALALSLIRLRRVSSIHWVYLIADLPSSAGQFSFAVVRGDVVRYLVAPIKISINHDRTFPPLTLALYVTDFIHRRETSLLPVPSVFAPSTAG